MMLSLIFFYSLARICFSKDKTDSCILLSFIYCILVSYSYWSRLVYFIVDNLDLMRSEGSMADSFLLRGRRLLSYLIVCD